MDARVNELVDQLPADQEEKVRVFLCVCGLMDGELAGTRNSKRGG